MAILTKRRNSWCSFIRMPNRQPLLISCRTQDEEEARKRNRNIVGLEVDLKSGKLTKDEFMNEVKEIIK